MNAVISTDLALNLRDKFQITATDLPHILERYGSKIKVLSLDCFDTILWRKTTSPREVFYVMEQRPLFKSLGVTAYQRINAAQRAYRQKFITHGHHQVTIHDIYRFFTSLTKEQQDALAEDELRCEMEMGYGFPPIIDLIKEAYLQGLKIIIVSDTYLNENQLTRLLAHCLPADVMKMISKIYCSCEFEKYKIEGLFEDILQLAELDAASILHLGDHRAADMDAPKRAGLHALHLVQFHPSANEFLRVLHATSALTALSNADSHQKRAPRYNPFRGVYGSSSTVVDKPETSIGYLSFGPMMFAFARFISDELNDLRKQGKRLKVFFLLRDAYLLSRACEAYAGEPVGKLVRIRKFVAVAASFRTQEDVDHYLSSIQPQYFNMVVICEQLLIPNELMMRMIKLANNSPKPEQTFYQLIHQPNVLQTIFENSRAYRERLKKYVQKEMGVEPGDTVVLVDTGYIGVTQEFFTRAFKDELNIEIIGRYFMGSHEPDRPNCKALITSSWCEHGLFEQSSTFKEGCVLDYDNDGNPIFDKIRLSDQQYEKVSALQAECLRFIHDAKTFFTKYPTELTFELLQQTAMAALKRHIFFPTKAEVEYFKIYQHDKDMGAAHNKTMYNIPASLTTLRQQLSPIKLHPYEARATDLNMTLSSLLQKSFDLDFTSDDMSLQTEEVKIILLNGTHAHQIDAKAMPTHDGYYSLTTPIIHTEQVGIVFGEKYQWLQIESINVTGDHLPRGVSLEKNIIFDKLTNHGGNLFECATKTSVLIFTALALPDAKHGYHFKIIFRPVIKRS